MSKKRNNTPNSRPAGPEPVEGSAQPQPDETGETGGNIEISALTFRQQSALPIIAASPTLAQAARDSGLSQRTLRRWLDDPNFREQLSRLQQEACNVARQQLQALMPHLISVLAREAIENPDPALRIRAARYAMNYAVRFSDLDRLTNDLNDIRALIQDNK